jgi:aquaporin Z|tara:strand:- start:404 stop:721 length:318 start_codon:yes stop_codon:yes gene_type:complete
MHIVSRLLVEFIGTFIFLGAIMATLKDGAIAALEVGLALAAVIFFGGKISGGHFNPAVSIMMLLRNQPDYGVGECIAYIISQIVGGICAYYFITCSLKVKSRKRK